MFRPKTSCRIVVAIALSVVARQQVHGDTIRLGVKIATLPLEAGSEVRSVEPSGVGARMGLRAGDVVLRANGRKVTRKEVVFEQLATGNIDLIWRRGEKFYLGSAALCESCPIDEPAETFTDVRAAREVDPDGQALTPPGVRPPVGVPLTLPEAPSPSDRGLRFGVWSQDFQFHNGVKAARVVRVDPDSPSQRMTQVGDDSGKTYHIVPDDNYILEVNGVAVTGHAQLAQAIAASPPVCTVRVFNGVTGKNAVYVARLR